MNKNFVFLTVFLASVFAGCSSDEPTAPEDRFDETFDGQAYMRVRISMADDATSRAEADGTFEAGSPEEQDIRDIGLKFYNSDGSFYGYGLPVDNTAANPGNTTADGIEEAVIVLQVNSNAPKPAYVVAYVNCGEQWKQFGSEPGIGTMDSDNAQISNSITAAYNKTVGETETTEYYYSMTSSNYYYSPIGTDDLLLGCKTPVSPDSFKPTEEEAKAGTVPVEIYVERLAAKVQVKTATNMTPQTINNNGYTLDFKIDGYALGGVNSESYYIKRLRMGWTPTSLWGGWNDDDNHRCYWALDVNYDNPINNPPTLGYVSYNDVKGSLANSKTGWLYTAENTIMGMTAPSNSTSTQDVQAAPRAEDVTELNRYLFQPFAYVIGNYVVKKDGVAVTDSYLYECAGKILPANVLLEYMQQISETVLYTRHENASSIEHRPVDMVKEELVEIGSYVDDKGKTDASLVCMQLTAKAKDEGGLDDYYIKKQNTTSGSGKGDGDYLPATVENVTPLLQQSKTQAYGFKYDEAAGGYLAYFPILIKHLNTGTNANESTTGYYGVVRNHCYKITINKITGLGIGIYDPTVDIIPKDKIKPLYLAAKFNVLPWKVVNQSVDL